MFGPSVSEETSPKAVDKKCEGGTIRAATVRESAMGIRTQQSLATYSQISLNTTFHLIQIPTKACSFTGHFRSADYDTVAAK